VKRADIKPGMAVYWYGPNGKWEYDRSREDPDACRWITDGTLYGKVGYGFGEFRESTPDNRVRATHVKVTRERPDGSQPLVVTTTYAPLAQILGPYDEVAPQRREIIKAERERLDRDKRDREDSYARAHAVTSMALALGYTGIDTRGSGTDLLIRMPLATFEKMIDAIDAADQRGVEAGREAGQLEMS
jgi:hypothetical protein